MTWTWRGIGVRWYTSRIIEGLKWERKKTRFIRPLRRRIFLIFPDFTAETMCVMKYAGTMLCRKGTITLWKSSGSMQDSAPTLDTLYYALLDGVRSSW